MLARIRSNRDAKNGSYSSPLSRNPSSGRAGAEQRLGRLAVTVPVKLRRPAASKILPRSPRILNPWSTLPRGRYVIVNGPTKRSYCPSFAIISYFEFDLLTWAQTFAVRQLNFG